MGEAARKAQVRDSTFEKAAELIRQHRTTEGQEPVEVFDWEEHDCPPDTVIVRRDADKELVAGEIIGGKKVRQQTGVVEISGWDWLKHGDQVLFSKFGGTDIQLDDAVLVHLHKLQIYDRKRKKQQA